MMKRSAFSDQLSALRAGFEFTEFLVVADGCRLIAESISEVARIAG